MPGNEVGDRVHNFFAQDNLPQAPHSQVVDGNWSLNDNLWAGSHKHFGGSGSNPRNFNPQQSETERGHGGQRVPVQHTFNFPQTTARPEFARSQPQSEQPNLNGYMFGRQAFQTRPDEANFLGVDTEPDRNNMNQRGFPLYNSQPESVSEQTQKNLFRSDTSDAHGSFDLFGGQSQMSSQYPGVLQPLQQQQSGFSDIQQLQQQLMLRKMQELQRQELQRQDLRQLEARQQNSVNQGPPFARQASGSHPHGFINGTPASDSSGYHWAELTPGNTNWLQRSSPVVQASSSGLAFSPEPGQPQRSMGFAHQQVDQSLYGVPVSSSRGPLNQYPHVSNSFPGNHYAAIPEQITVQDGASVNRQGVLGKGLFGPNSGMKMERVQQLKAPQNASMQDLFGPSEIVQDKSATEVTTSSHGQASLDPDEEKILFGSDDNIWNAFGSDKNTGGGVSNLLDDNEFASGLPSLQSGSWSALMQSAVAETTSSGGGLQEEWTDLNFQNPEHSSGKHPEDRGKQQTALGAVNLPNASGLSFGSAPLSDGANMNSKHHSNMGFQHHGKNIPYEHEERLQMNYSKQMNHHSQQYGTKQPDNKQNNWNTNESVQPPAYTGFNINESINSLQKSQSNDRKEVMHDEMGQNPFLHPNIEPEPVKSSLFSPQISRDGFPIGSAAATNLSNLQGGNHHLNYWKQVDSSGKSQRGLKKGPQVSESSFNSSDKEDLSSKRENSNDSYRSASSHRANTVGLSDKFSSDAGDSRSMPGTKQGLSNQAGQKSSGPRKFQYHPMGNLDEDVGMPYGTRQGTNTQAMSLQHSRGLGGQDQGNFGHTKIRGQGHVPELEGISKGSDDMRFKGMIPGHVPKMFAPQDRSVGLSVSDKASQASQNMLELLHKVDQSRDRGIARHLNSFERNLSSEVPEPENSDGSFGGHQRSQSSNSQGIGLQLGPPSQRAPFTSPRTMHTVKPNSLSRAQTQASVSSNQRGMGQAEPSPFPSFQEATRGESKNDRITIEGETAIERQTAVASETQGHKMTPEFSSALSTDFPNARSQLQNRQIFNGQSLEGLGLGSLPIAASSQSSAGEKLPATQPRANSVMPNAWTNQARKGQSKNSSSHQLNIVESTSLGRQNLEEQEAEKKGNSLPKFGASSFNSRGFASLGEKSAKESLNLSSEKIDRAGNDSATQRDLEAFGRSLKPNNFHQNYSLLNQMKAMKNPDNDTNNRVLKRSKDSDNSLGSQQVAPWSGQPREHNSIVENASTSKDTLASDHNESQSCIPSDKSISVKIEHSHISPQMAPSWFDQYGTFKNDQMLPRRVDAVKTMEQPFSIGRVSSSLETHSSKEQVSAPAETGRAGVIWKNPVDSSAPPLPANLEVQSLVTLRPEKRKRATVDLHPWLKEVLGGSKNFQGIYTAATEWCRAANRLMEKVEDDGEVIEDVLTVPRPKRRIILTTHLMQQLLSPPPGAILSTVATSNYESVTFYAARLALGDACNLVSSARSCSSVSHGGPNIFSDKSRDSDRTDSRHLSEVVEDYTSKARKLEDDFSRLDKRASILDLRLESQDLERFSVINRFAKFHGRGQSDSPGAEPSSSDAASNTPKPFPQRYVIAVPLPKNLPERVHCLSL